MDILSQLLGGLVPGMGQQPQSPPAPEPVEEPESALEPLPDRRLTYRDAGVDKEEAARAVELIKKHAERTFDKRVLTGLGGFGGLYMPDLAGIKEPVLVSGTDGVGTKLMIAFMMDKHDTIGQDCVAMCVNDVLCQGAMPLFFLDYVAKGRMDAERVEDIVRGIADGCVLAGCALVGGETAEMPGLYLEDEYDLVGFCVGIVDKSKIIDGKNVTAGDTIIGLKSSGLHSNGFSLARKVLLEKGALKLSDRFAELGGLRLGDVLLEPTKIYTKQVQTILDITMPKALVHITGGGFSENIPRVMPEGLGVRIDKDAWERPLIFDVIQRLGDVEEAEMFSTFNMGIGMIAIVDKATAEQVVASLNAENEEAVIIGEVVSR